MSKKSKQNSPCCGDSCDIGSMKAKGLTERERELVAIGASIGGNCIPCLEYHYEKCIALGFTKEQMQDAIDVAKKVKEVPNNKIYETANKLVAGNNEKGEPCCKPDGKGKPCC